jgi:hypothetical protein
LGAVALADPFDDGWSEIGVVSFGMEFVVEARGVKPGWKEAEGREALVGPLLVEGLAELTTGS